MLNSLVEKGIVSYKVINNIKIFMPAPPDAIMDLYRARKEFLDNQEADLKAIVADLKAKRALIQEAFDYKYFEGVNGIKSMWSEINSLINSSHPMKVYCGKKGSYEILLSLFDVHHRLRQRKKIHERLILSSEDRRLVARRKNALTDVRHLSLANPVEWGIWNDLFYVNHYLTGKKPKSFLIKDKYIASTFEEVFDHLWDTAKETL